MTEEEKIIDQMKDDFSMICNFARGLKATLEPRLDAMPDGPIIMLTLTKISELADRNI